MGQKVTHTFTIEAIHCANCCTLIDSHVENLDGVFSSAASMREGHSIVELDPDLCAPADVIAAIGSTGYTATLARP